MFNLKTLWKDNFRGITSSFSRFISITLIVMLGVAIFSGITAAGPDMLETARYDYEKGNLSDQTVMSTVGLNQEDIDTMESVEGATVESMYHQDLVLDNSNTTVRFYSYNSDQQFNQYSIMEGRLPEAPNEIALDNIDTLTSEYSIGDTLTINDAENSSLLETEFEVVGFVSAPQFVDNVSRGVTTAGSGTLEGFGVVHEDVFDMENKTLANIKYDGTENLEAYTKEYEDTINSKNEEMQTALDEQAAGREEEIRDEIDQQVNDGEAQIQNARDELANAESQLNATRQQLQASGVLDLPQEALPAEISSQVQAFNEAEAAFAEQSQTAEEEISQAETELEDARALQENLAVEFFLQDRSNYPGYIEYQSNADRINAIARVFPVFFFLVALLVTLTTMTRMVDEDRSHIGTLKALGYANGHIAIKYITYSGLAGLIGAISGLIVGYWLFPQVIIQAYSSLYEFSTIQTPWYGWITAISLIAAFIATVGATLSALWPSLKALPADLLTDPAPKKGKKIFLEHWTWLWDKISFNYKVALRNIFRYKKRMWMTIIGVAGCTALMLLGFGVSDSVNDILDGQYSDYVRYDGMAILDTEDENYEASEFASIVDNMEEIESSKPLYNETYTTETENEGDLDVSLIIPESMENMDQYRGLVDVETGETITELPTDGVMLTQKIAELKNVDVGDEVTVENTDGESYTFTVSKTFENYVGHQMMMAPEVYEQAIGESPTINTHWLTFEPTSENETTIEQELSEQSYVQSTVMTSMIASGFSDSLASLDFIVLILIIAAALLAIVVLYNLTNVNVAERKKELATLQVLGFHDLELTMYIYRENIFLTLFGILFGYVLGYFLHAYIIYTVEFNNMMFGRTIHLSSYAYSTALTIIFSILVLVIIHFKLKKSNMLEALDEE